MAFAQKMASVPVSKVELSIKCQNLMNKDITSKSDPCVIVYLKDQKKLTEFGRTENIKNSLDPEFSRSFEIDYYFEEVQTLYFAVYDIDNDTPKLSDDDFLGGMECSLGQLVSGSPYTQPLMMKEGKRAKSGTIMIRTEEVAKLQDILSLTFRANNLDNKDFLGKSDPYLELSRQTSDGKWQVVARTEVVKNNLNPQWRILTIKAQKLCAGNYEAPIRVACYDYDEGDDHDLIGAFESTLPQFIEATTREVSCFDYDSDGSHDLIGVFTTTAAEFLTAAKKEVSWPVINPKKQAKKKSYSNSGVVYLSSCTVTKDYTFLDYVFGGMQINCTIGIDFTGSNGDPRSPQSLHYINPYEPNEYMRAITSVGTVIQDYDSDQMFPVLGFGAQIPPDMKVSHEFACNFNASNPFCAGINGVLEAYKQCVAQVRLYGPTNFSPIINHVSQFSAAARKEQGSKNYFVLLIITDGVITDIKETIRAIVYASTLPMSIIIVGVGYADYSAMDMLDSDDKLLKDYTGAKAKRDIVQFVPFRDFMHLSPAALAKHVLAEIPRQVTDYYKMAGISPGTAPTSAS